uniref:NADH-ubiquinone oxidoreductase chain 3 n=1 Tax=Trouessartia rubecula TaxID=474308 RepID=A0A410HYJ9_9ACAR|nr:NADH dehydrogenase subunit 3 [Trouessartia rubecula]QAB47269.1 NADH dehydrogenase subunit 3 [Trouessartia rubecula]
MFSYMLLFTIFLGVLFFFLVSVLFFFNPILFNKSVAFECGFQPFLSSGYVFSMPFFVICLMFLLFDVEIVIVCFPSICGLDFFCWFWVSIILIFFATCYEWKSGVLKWV